MLIRKSVCMFDWGRAATGGERGERSTWALCVGHDASELHWASRSREATRHGSAVRKIARKNH